MKQICRFNKKRDLQETVPGLSPDLSLSIKEGVVLDIATNPEYNSIDDPLNIVGRVRDVFDVIEAQRNIKKSAVAPVEPVAEESKNE